MSWGYTIFVNSNVSLVESRAKLARILQVEWEYDSAKILGSYAEFSRCGLVVRFYDRNIYHDDAEDDPWNAYSYVINVNRDKHTQVIDGKSIFYPNAIEYARAASVYWAELMVEFFDWDVLVYWELDSLMYPEPASMN